MGTEHFDDIMKEFTKISCIRISVAMLALSPLVFGLPGSAHTHKHDHSKNLAGIGPTEPAYAADNGEEPSSHHLSRTKRQIAPEDPKPTKNRSCPPDINKINSTQQQQQQQRPPGAKFLTPLMEAAQDGDLTLVRHYVETCGADIELRSPHKGGNALHMAAKNGHAKVTEYLLQAGADPDVRMSQNGFAPIHLAVTNPNVDPIPVLKTLYARGAFMDMETYSGETIMDLAHRVSREESVRWLLHTPNAFGVIRSAMPRSVCLKKYFDTRGAARTMIRTRPSLDRITYYFAALSLCRPGHLLYAWYGIVAMAFAAVTGDTSLLSFLSHAGIFGNVGNERGEGMLHVAVRAQKRPDFIKTLISITDADVNLSTFDGETPLDLLLELGRLKEGGVDNETRKVLEDAGARRTSHDEQECPANIYKKDDAGWTPLHYAVSSGSVARVKYLMEHCEALVNIRGGECGTTPLHEAVLKGDLAMVAELTRLGALLNAPSTNCSSPIHAAARAGNFHVLAFLTRAGAAIHLPDQDGARPLDIAVEMHGTDSLIAEYLRDRLESRAARRPKNCEPAEDVDVLDARGYTLLHKASFAPGNPEKVKLLLECGANPNVRSTRSSEEGFGTPLHDAAYAGNPEVIRALLAGGADPSLRKKDDYFTQAIALIFLKKANFTDALMEFVKGGADLNQPDKGGNSPLDRASWDAPVKLNYIRILKKYGAMCRTNCA